MGQNHRSVCSLAHAWSEISLPAEFDGRQTRPTDVPTFDNVDVLVRQREGHRIAQLDIQPVFADTGALDIELPFRTRAADAANQRRGERRAAPRVRETPVTALPTLVCAHLPLLDELMAAPPGRYALEVEVKQDERVVGTWQLDVSPRNACAVYVSQARAALHVCVSAAGDPRATGAFLVLSHWWVNAGDDEQLGQLYDELTAETLARLGSLTEHIPAHAEPMPPLVLYLVDGRTRKVKFFSLPRLASELLDALGESDAVPKLALLVAHGKGLGSSPVASTMPADLPVSEEAVAPTRPSAPARGVPHTPRGMSRRGECSSARSCRRKT
jgi:hypothetical protein